MNILTRVAPSFCHILQSFKTASAASTWTVSRTFSALTGVKSEPIAVNKQEQSSTHTGNMHLVPQISNIQMQQCRTYKVKSELKRRCPGCYFERRFGRLYIECTLKPRHKQMQQLRGMNVFKNDYSTGSWKKAVFWGREKKNFYKYNNTHANYKWLGDRIGKDL